MDAFDMDEEIVAALIGFHAFTGNDFVSSIFRKGKDHCWKIFEKSPKFISTFNLLGDAWEPTLELFDRLQEYVCKLYGSREKKVDVVRYQLFMKKNQREHKAVDLATLPPCERVFWFHCLRASTVAKIWKSATQSVVDVPALNECGWYGNGDIQWLTEPYPQEIENILVEEVGESDDEQYGSEIESDTSDEDF